MSAWTYVDGNPSLPDHAVLVTFTDRGGRRRATVATYYGAKELESGEDGRTEDVYDEDTDKYWAPPGWYETPLSAEEVYPLDGVVVAWMPLAVAPERDHTEDSLAIVEPAPAPAHFLCLSCGRHPAEHLTYTDHRGDRWHDLYGEVQCGPCQPAAGAAP